MRFAIIFAATILAGCATAEKFTVKMNRFIGQNEVVLVSYYGPPQSSYAASGGVRVLQYTRGGQTILPGATTYDAVTTNTTGNAAVYQGMQQATGTYSQKSTTYVPRQLPPTVVSYSCTVNFTVGADAFRIN